MVAAVQLEKSVANACILWIVISKLGYWEESRLIILFEIDEGSEVRFYRTILTFRLAVRLRVERGGKPPFDAEEVAER